MKTLIYLTFVAFMMLFGCAKDSLTDENTDLKKAKVPIPLKADFCMTPNMEAPFMHIVGLDSKLQTSYLPGAGWVSGHATHAGEIQMKESAMTAISAYFDFEKMQVVWEITGKITAANGDYYFYDGTSYSNPMDGTFTGDIFMRDGVGKFSGMTGTAKMVGKGTCWHAEGTMTYSK